MSDPENISDHDEPQPWPEGVTDAWPWNGPEHRDRIRPTFEVRFETLGRAKTPEQAARIARDLLMDPDARLHCDVYPYEWVEAADDWLWTSAHGTTVYFGDHRKGAVANPVRPSESVKWKRVTLESGKD